jgi:hypothetical protein
MAASSLARKPPPPTLNVCRVCGKSFFMPGRHQSCSADCRLQLYQNKGSPDECWEWSGPLLGGYGKLWLGSYTAAGRRRSVFAHRHSFVNSGGVLTPDRPCVLHSCDNPKCTNPAHLRAGTRGENNAERSAKGRSGSKTYSADERARYSEMNRGERHTLAKLTNEQAKQIKYGHIGLINREVAKLYGVSVAVVQHIRTGRAWRHV